VVTQHCSTDQYYQAETESIPNFCKVIDMMKEARKPLVVHCGLFDIALMFEHFICDLPEKLSDFKRLLSKYFPTIIDTKYIASSIPFRVIRILYFGPC